MPAIIIIVSTRMNNFHFLTVRNLDDRCANVVQVAGFKLLGNN